MCCKVLEHPTTHAVNPETNKPWGLNHSKHQDSQPKRLLPSALRPTLELPFQVTYYYADLENANQKYSSQSFLSEL